MSDSADLVCFDCGLRLPLGHFWNVTEPGERYLFDADGRPSSDSAGLGRALWRMLAEHVYHELRVVGEQSDQLERIDPFTLRTIGGDLKQDPSLAEYLADWHG